jgi:hypothetical protein
VIFLHGFPETGLLSWHHQLHFFGQQDKYFLVAPDMRGYNTSDKPDGVANYRHNELAQDVVDLIDHYGKEDAIVVGHDWVLICSSQDSSFSFCSRLLFFNSYFREQLLLGGQQSTTLLESQSSLF